MTPIGLARMIAKLSEGGDITRRFEKELFVRGWWSYEREKKKYSSQKAHWIGWLSEYSSTGYYNRKNKAVRSAEIVYNRIGCPPMLLWLCEASRVSPRQIRSAMRAALLVGSNYRRQCKEIRKIIPWSIVEPSLQRSIKSVLRAAGRTAT